LTDEEPAKELTWKVVDDAWRTGRPWTPFLDALKEGKTIYLNGYIREDKLRRFVRLQGYRLHVRKAGPPDFDHGHIIWMEEVDAAE